MTESEGDNSVKRQCSLLLFVSTPAEEEALLSIAKERMLRFERVRNVDLPELGEYHWMGAVGNETVIAVRPVRERGRVVMGEIGRLGSAARAIRFRQATAAQAVVQLGMAFGIDPRSQRLGDVLVSTSLIPYDNRTVKSRRHWFRRLFCGQEYLVDYSAANRQPARQSLVEFFLRERERCGHSFGIHVGAMLSGAARIHSRRFRDELVAGVPGGDDPIVGGEMEGAGLLAATTDPDDPVWCVVKGISDFADEERDRVIEQARHMACRNAADFVLSALSNDADR